MTIHQPGTPMHAWRCTQCPACRAGYPSDSAAIRAERRHIEQAHPRPTAGTP